MKLVSDTGPLIGLAKIGQIYLLKNLAELDEGEKQAIALASISEGDVLLLLDDRAGRTVADNMHIPTTGLIGVLLLAKEKGLVENIGPLIENLRHNGYWISDEIMEIAMKLAGE